MKLFSAEQIRACDLATINNTNISAIDLMERAAMACVSWLLANFNTNSVFAIICGTGNNGGDGLAITRLLHNEGYNVKAFILNTGIQKSTCCELNLKRLQDMDAGLFTLLDVDTFIEDLPKDIIIIDAILGTGLNRVIAGWVAQFIEHLNLLPNRKISIDIPSGLFADYFVTNNSTIIKAETTLSFQYYKRTFLHAESAIYVGKIVILDIGLDKDFEFSTQTNYHLLEQNEILSIYKPRTKFGHKGNFGNVLIAGGSYGKIGAVALSANAALRTGAGLVTALLPHCGYSIMQTYLPEVMCKTNGEKAIESVEDYESYNAIGIGPGLGKDEKTIDAFSVFITNYNQPLVLDADALNMIANKKELLSKLPANSILTPHPKEFTRLFGSSENSLLQVDKARMIAMRYNIIIVLKNHHTAILSPTGQCFYNNTGNSGMATGGSGDVLTGIITSLLAQGYQPLEASKFGVYLHGLAGDFAALELSEEAMVASDIIYNLGNAFNKITNSLNT